MRNSAKIPDIRLSPGFILIWILCDPTDFGQFSSNERCEESRKGPGNEKSFTAHISIELCSCHNTPDLYYVLLVPWTAIQSYTHTNRCIQTDIGITYKMYKDAESDLAVNFSYISSQYKTQSCFFLLAFPKALNISPATQSPGPGQMLEQPFPQKLHGKQTYMESRQKTAEKSKKRGWG